MLSIYLAYDELTVTILAAIGTSIGSVGENMLIMLTLEMFPTNLRYRHLFHLFIFLKLILNF